MRKTIKSLEIELRNERADKIMWREKYYKSSEDRNILECWIKGKFNWWLELITTSPTGTPCLKYLIKNTAEILGMKHFD